MSNPIGNEVRRLSQLRWQPGQWMHERWWEVLKLTPWQQSYQRLPACRSAIDPIIIRRRGLTASPLPSRLSLNQKKLLSLEPRLLQLCTALGVLTFSCPDYLRLGSYRRYLAAELGENVCDQLLAQGSFTDPCPPELSPEQLLAHAKQRGIGWWRADDGHCPVYQALDLTLPPGKAEPFPVFCSIIPCLLRICRFL